MPAWVQELIGIKRGEVRFQKHPPSTLSVKSFQFYPTALFSTCQIFNPLGTHNGCNTWIQYRGNPYSLTRDIEMYKTFSLAFAFVEYNILDNFLSKLFISKSQLKHTSILDNRQLLQPSPCLQALFSRLSSFSLQIYSQFLEPLMILHGVSRSPYVSVSTRTSLPATTFPSNSPCVVSQFLCPRRSL